MDDRENSAAFNEPPEGHDPVSHQLAAIQTRLDIIEAAITFRNARHRQRAWHVPLRAVFASFGFGLVVGAIVTVLLGLSWQTGAGPPLRDFPIRDPDRGGEFPHDGGGMPPALMSGFDRSGTPVPVIGLYLRDHADALNIQRAAGGISGAQQADVEHVNESIERIARLTGLSPETVLKQGIIRSKIPLYALGSGLAMPVIGDLARQDNYQQ